VRRLVLPLAGLAVLLVGVAAAAFANATKAEARWLLAHLVSVTWRVAVAALVFALSLTPAGCLVDSSSDGAPGDPSSAGVIDSDAFWSPDSRSIAFDRSDYGSPDDTGSGSSDVFVASADGRELRQLTRTPHNETVLGWLSNPLRIVYSTYEKQQRPTTLYALNLKGGAPVMFGQVRAADQLLALSHDARRALVGTPSLDPKRYALVDLVRKTRRPLPGRGDYWMDGAWSADDSLLAYVTGDSIVILRGDRVIRRVPLGTYDAASGGLAWSPDGARLAYGAGGDQSSLWLVRIKDGSRTRLTGGGGETSDQYPVWSPDGSKIYYEHGSFDDHDGLRAIAPDVTADRKITDDDWGDFFSDLFSSGKNDRWLEQARISPDGTKIAYLLGERGAWKNWSLLGVMNADGSGKTPLPGSL
jgi:Tol biopolymer transport system component